MFLGRLDVLDWLIISLVIVLRYMSSSMACSGSGVQVDWALSGVVPVSGVSAKSVGYAFVGRILRGPCEARIHLLCCSWGKSLSPC